MSLLKAAYYEGVKAAAAAFTPKVVAPPAVSMPKPPEVAKPAVPPSPGGMKVPATSVGVKPPVSGSAAPVGTSVSSGSAGSDTATRVKGSEFNMGLRPKSKPAPGEIAPDNGVRQLGTNFEEGTARTLGRGFDTMVDQKNVDILGAGEDAALVPPGWGHTSY